MTEGDEVSSYPAMAAISEKKNIKKTIIDDTFLFTLYSKKGQCRRFELHCVHYHAAIQKELTGGDNGDQLITHRNYIVSCNYYMIMYVDTGNYV